LVDSIFNPCLLILTSIDETSVNSMQAHLAARILNC
jgi:hypothetical protein